MMNRARLQIKAPDLQDEIFRRFEIDESNFLSDDGFLNEAPANGPNLKIGLIECEISNSDLKCLVLP